MCSRWARRLPLTTWCGSAMLAAYRGSLARLLNAVYVDWQTSIPMHVSLSRDVTSTELMSQCPADGDGIAALPAACV